MNVNLNKLPWLLVAGLCAAVAATPARAQTVQQQATPPAAEPWQVALGMRNAFWRSAGYDPFSSDDVLTQVTLGFERALARHDRLSFAAGAGVDYGGSDASARGAPSALKIWRLSLLAEGRYQLLERAYGFVRFAPGMMHATAELDDGSTVNGASLHDTFDVLAVDASAGAAVRLTSPGSPVAAWVSAEGGYGWAASHHLLLTTEVAARDQAKLAPLDLGTIDPRGAFMRLSVALGF